MVGSKIPNILHVFAHTCHAIERSTVWDLDFAKREKGEARLTRRLIFCCKLCKVPSNSPESKPGQKNAKV